MAHTAAPSPSPPRHHQHHHYSGSNGGGPPPLKVESVLRGHPVLDGELLPPGTRANGAHPPVPEEVVTVRLYNHECSHYEFKLKARATTVSRLVAKPSRGVIPPGRTAVVTLSTNDGGSADAVLAAGPVLCSRPIEGQAWAQTNISLSSPYPSPDATDPRPVRRPATAAHHRQQHPSVVPPQHSDPYGGSVEGPGAAGATSSPPPQRGSLQSESGQPHVGFANAESGGRMPAAASTSRAASPKHGSPPAGYGATPPPDDISAVLAVSPMVPGDYAGLADGYQHNTDDDNDHGEPQQQQQQQRQEPTVGTSVLERWGEYDALVAGLLGYLAEGCRVKRGSRSVHGAPTARIMQIVAARPAGAAAAGHGGVVRISKDGAASSGAAAVEEVKLRSVSSIVLGRPLAGGAPPPTQPQQQQQPQHGGGAAAATGGASTHQRTIALEDAAGTLLAHVRTYTWDDFEASIAALFLLRAPGTSVRWQLPDQQQQHQHHKPQTRKGATTTATTAARGRATTAAAARTTQSSRTRSANQAGSAPGSRTNTPRGRASAGSLVGAAAPPSEEAIVAQLGIKPEAFRACREAVMRRGPGALVTPLDLVEDHGMSLFHAVAAVELIGRFPAAPGSGDGTAALRTIPVTVRN